MSMNSTPITLSGNLTEDVTLRNVNGRSVANFNIASTPRKYDKNSGEWVDKTPIFVRCSAWGQMADNLAATASKGTRLVVTGELEGNEYEVDGQRRYSLQMRVDDVGASLLFATANVTKSNRGSSNASNSASQSQDTNGWGSDDSAGDDAPPF